MITLIFDFDGTLVDSYLSIIDRFNKALNHFGIKYSFEYSYKQIINSSADAFLNDICKEHQINRKDFDDYYSTLESNLDIIKLMPNAIETLDYLKSKDIKMFLYTHRGITLPYVLKKLDLEKYFVENIDSTCGFKRKPSGDALNYLLNKYNLCKDDTYYVGDREIDIKSADNAHIKSIFYNSANISINIKPTFKINNLVQLCDLFK